MLLGKKSQLISYEVMRILENIVDSNGYEITSHYWTILLDKLAQVVNQSDKQSLSEDMSRVCWFTRLQHHPKTDDQLYDLAQ